MSFKSNGLSDVFLAAFAGNGYAQWAATWGGIDMDQGNAAAIGETGDLYIGGSFDKTVDFDPGDGVLTLYSKGWYDAFLSKFAP